MTTLKIKLSPGSHANKIWGWEGDRLKVSVTAVTEDGKANEALIDVLSEKLHFASSNFRITYGKTDRLKTLEVWNIDQPYLAERFARLGFPPPWTEKPKESTEKGH